MTGELERLRAENAELIRECNEARARDYIPPILVVGEAAAPPLPVTGEKWRNDLTRPQSGSCGSISDAMPWNAGPSLLGTPDADLPKPEPSRTTVPWGERAYKGCSVDLAVSARDARIAELRALLAPRAATPTRISEEAFERARDAYLDTCDDVATSLRAALASLGIEVGGEIAADRSKA